MGYINFCSLPYTFRRNGTFYLYFRLPDNRFFKSSLACTEIKRARFLTSRLMLFISLLKLGRIENSQLQTIVRKMRQLTQRDIDEYLLEVQTEIYEEARRTKFEAREASTSGGKPIPVDLAKGFSEFAGEHLDNTLYNGAKPFSNDHIWELETVKQVHYHLWIALPGNQVQNTGHVDYGMFQIINDLWLNLTKGLGSAHLAKNSYMIKRSDDKELKKFVYRISYLAKDRGKYSKGDKTKRFDGSRLFGKLATTGIEKQVA